MQASQPSSGSTRYRPSSVSVFAAAFVAGAVVAFGLNRMVDVHLAQSRPQVESVPIFVALHSLPQGAPVTVWDVALRDWPKAMLPTTALMAEDSFEGMILKHPLRAGQPLLSVQLMRAEPQAAAEPQRQDEVFAAPTPASRQERQPTADAGADLWTPAAAVTQVAPPADAPRPTPHEPVAQPTIAQQPVAQPSVEPTVTEQPPTEQLPAVSIASTPTEDAEPVQEPAPAPEVSPDVPADPEHVAVVSDEVTEAVIEDRPTEPTLADSVAPVPASPLTDIERPLKAMSSQRLARRPPAFTDTPYSGPAVAESVLTAAPTAAPAATPAAGADSAQQPPRYLVVPERIALEADASFAAPPAAQPVPAPPVPAQPSRGAAAASRPQPTRQGQPRPATATTQAQRQREPMFPNMAAGLEALGAPLRGSQAAPPTRPR